MPFNQFQSQGVLPNFPLPPAATATAAELEEELDTAIFWRSSNKRRLIITEPTSVLDKRRSPSPSPPTSSSSTLSSSLGSSSNGGGGASSDSAAGAPDHLNHATAAAVIDVGPEKCNLGGGAHLEDWETMLADSGAAAGNVQDPSFLRWIMGDNGVIVDDTNASNFGFIDPSFGLESLPFPAAQQQLPLPLPPISVPNSMFLQEPIEEKPALYNPNLILNHHQHPPTHQNPSFLLPLPQFNAQFETHHPHFPETGPNSLFLRRNQLQNPAQLKPKGGDELAGQQQALVDQLFKAAELVEAGNSIGARGILARLNQQLPSHHPVIGKPLFRSAFYFREALLLLTSSSNPMNNPPVSTPLDVLLKLGTYKAFSEISPILQFTNFTSIQAILEQLNGCNRIHVVDFDVGIGGHWSSFMQELAHRRNGGGSVTSLKITAFASHSSHHPLELHLTRDNLSHFAADLNIPFEFNVLSLDSFDPSAVLAMTSPDEAIAVNFPIGSVLNHQSIPTILRLVKQLNPKIVVSVEHGCERSDLQFSHHFLHAFQACTILLDSIDASGANQDVANKIERYLVQPRIENAVLGRHRAVENKMVPWRALFASAGFVPLQFSNFTESQAECLLKRVQVRGYQVEKRQASLFLCWQRGDLVSVSAWKC